MPDSFRPTEEQLKIIQHPGPAFVSACPGAGKTRVLVERARSLLRERNPGRGIAFLSFTNAAVSELEIRLRQESLLPSPAFPHFIGTFDRFLWQFLIVPLGIPGTSAAPRIVPDLSKRTVTPFPQAQPLPLSCFDRNTGAVIASSAKANGYDVAARPLSTTKAYETSAIKIWRRFALRGEIDFEGARKIARSRLDDSEISNRLSAALAARFREVIVDETQDCNIDDIDIIDWLRNSGIVTKVICDPHQSIYGFRGGVTKELLAFRETFSAQDRLSMRGNFRSTENICKAIVTLRPRDARATIDEALGRYRSDRNPVHVLSYSGTGVPPSIGEKFQELLTELKLEVGECPVLAATRASGARAIGQPSTNREDLIIRLATAVINFQFALEIGNVKSAVEEAHQVVLQIEGVLGPKTYHQYVVTAGIRPDSWRPQVLELLKELRYDPISYPTPQAWHTRAKEMLASRLPPDGQSISQRLRWNSELPAALAVAPVAGPCAKTIHAAKGLQFPAVCVVMTARTAKAILDYLETDSPNDKAEDAREIYVAASRAERLLTFAAPRSQAERLAAHLMTTGSKVILLEL